MNADLSELEPVERRSTAAIVADRIRTAIMRGTFPPGTQLGEVELAAALGVSRGPLREAMQRLVAEGLLHSERHRGLFVRQLDAADVRDVYTARTAIEGAAALLLLAGDRAAATERLTVALARMEAVADDPVALADADHAFHADFVADPPAVLRADQRAPRAARCRARRRRRADDGRAGGAHGRRRGADPGPWTVPRSGRAGVRWLG